MQIKCNAAVAKEKKCFDEGGPFGFSIDFTFQAEKKMIPSCSTAVFTFLLLTLALYVTVMYVFIYWIDFYSKLI